MRYCWIKWYGHLTFGYLLPNYPIKRFYKFIFPLATLLFNPTCIKYFYFTPCLNECSLNPSPQSERAHSLGNIICIKFLLYSLGALHCLFLFLKCVTSYQKHNLGQRKGNTHSWAVSRYFPTLSTLSQPSFLWSRFIIKAPIGFLRFFTLSAFIWIFKMFQITCYWV